MTRRILHIASTFEMGAAQKQMALLAGGLPGDEFDVHVAALGGGPLASQLERQQVSVRSFGNSRQFDPPAWWQLRRHIVRLQPDVVHTWPAAGNLVGRCVALAAGAKRLAATTLGGTPSTSLVDRAGNRCLATRTQRIIADSRALAGLCIGQGLAADKIRVIARGVLPTEPSDRTREQLLEELQLPSGARLIATVGRLEWHERIKDLIWAADLLKVIREDAHLLIIGDGRLRENLERYRRLCRIEDKVHFLGFRRDLLQLMPHFDLLWQAGASGGLSSVIMEAMAAGVPVAATDTASNRELMVDQETGYLVPLGDRAGLGRRANQVLDDPRLSARLGAAARQRMASEFTVQTMVAAHAALYREMME